MNLLKHLQKSAEERRQIWEANFLAHGKARDEEETEQAKLPHPHARDLLLRMREATAQNERLRIMNQSSNKY